VKSKSYDGGEVCIVSQDFHEQIERTLRSALGVFDASKAESVIQECCFISYDKTKPARFINRERISGRHVIIILDDLLQDYWEKEKEIVKILFDELAHYELDQKDEETSPRDVKKAHDLGKSRFEQWLKMPKKESRT
jgi:hypothetical protein